MTRKIFRSIVLVAGTVLLASLLLILGYLYDFFGGVQETQLQGRADAGLRRGGEHRAGTTSRSSRPTASA